MQAAVREAREETGLRIRLLAPLSPANYPHPVFPTAWHIAEIRGQPQPAPPPPPRHIFVGVADQPLDPVAQTERTVHFEHGG